MELLDQVLVRLPRRKSGSQQVVAGLVSDVGAERVTIWTIPNLRTPAFVLDFPAEPLARLEDAGEQGGWLPRVAESGNGPR